MKYCIFHFFQQLIDAVVRSDMRNLVLVLAHCRAEHVNSPYSKSDLRTALHIAAAMGNIVFVQMLLWVGIFSYLFVI